MTVRRTWGEASAVRWDESNRRGAGRRELVTATESNDGRTLHVVWTAERSWVRSPVANVPAACWLSRTCCRSGA